MAKEKTFDKLEETIEALTITMRKNSNKVVEEMAKLVKKEVKKNTSIADVHTPDWLKRMGHPYSGSGVIPHNSPLVHKVSGNLTNNVEIFSGRRKDELKVGISQAKVPYVGYIINGTSKMIARDFLSFSLLSVQKKLRKLVVRNFKETLKSKRLLRDIGSLKK